MLLCSRELHDSCKGKYCILENIAISRLYLDIDENIMNENEVNDAQYSAKTKKSINGCINEWEITKSTNISVNDTYAPFFLN